MRVARILLSMAIAACIFGCNDGDYVVEPTNSTGACGPLRSQLTIQDRMSQPSSVFSVGEPIRFSLSIANNSPEIVRLAPAACAPVRYEVFDFAKRSVWDSESGRVCIAMVVLVVFQPYEQRTFDATWDQVATGVVEPPGAYTAHANAGNFILDANLATQLDCKNTLNTSAPFRIQ